MLTLLCCANTTAQTIGYRYKKCTLKYNKIDEYNVEVAIQDNSLSEEKIYIPNEINYNDTMYYVIGIAEGAFSGNNHIKQVYFSDEADIKYIAEGAFSGCERLIDIELPSTLTEIAPYTFAWCKSLKYIEIHNLITKIGERAFTNCTNLAHVDMGENVEEIGNFAFAWCSSLNSITIPEKTRKLGYEIVQGNQNLDTIFYNAIDCRMSGAYYDERVERTIGAFEGNNGLRKCFFWR